MAMGGLKELMADRVQELLHRLPQSFSEGISLKQIWARILNYTLTQVEYLQVD